MKHNYISNQVIRYIYRELPALEHLETEYAIETEAEYANAYKRLNSSFMLLPKVSFYPSKRSLNSILEYSKQLA